MSGELGGGGGAHLHRRFLLKFQNVDYLQFDRFRCFSGLKTTESREKTTGLTWFVLIFYSPLLAISIELLWEIVNLMYKRKAEQTAKSEIPTNGLTSNLIETLQRDRQTDSDKTEQNRTEQNRT